MHLLDQLPPREPRVSTTIARPGSSRVTRALVTTWVGSHDSSDAGAVIAWACALLEARGCCWLAPRHRPGCGPYMWPPTPPRGRPPIPCRPAAHTTRPGRARAPWRPGCDGTLRLPPTQRRNISSRAARPGTPAHRQHMAHAARRHATARRTPPDGRAWAATPSFAIHHIAAACRLPPPPRRIAEVALRFSEVHGCLGQRHAPDLPQRRSPATAHPVHVITPTLTVTLTAAAAIIIVILQRCPGLSPPCPVILLITARLFQLAAAAEDGGDSGHGPISGATDAGHPVVPVEAVTPVVGTVNEAQLMHYDCTQGVLCGRPEQLPCQSAVSANGPHS
jgi:hypothetical protein